MKKRKSEDGRGRPRAFDAEKALEQAMQIFWKKGYEGTSLTDLTKAMGINRPSLYAAFGNKTELFRKVVRRYMCQGPGAGMKKALAAPSARQAVACMMSELAEGLGDPSKPRGCLLVQSALVGGEGASALRDEVAALRKQGDGALKKRLQRARREGELPGGTDCGDLARYFSTMASGMAVEAVNGASRAKLQRLAKMAMRAWPAN